MKPTTSFDLESLLKSDPQSAVDQFKAELASLLNKYNAVIWVGYDDCSDTYGVYGEHMSVHFNSDWHTGHRIVDGWGISASDLRDESEEE